MDHEDEGFKHIGELVPYKIEAKIYYGIFIASKIRKLLKDEDFKLN